MSMLPKKYLSICEGNVYLPLSSHALIRSSMRWFLPDSILVTHFCIISLRASCLNYKSFKMLQLALLHCLLNVLNITPILQSLHWLPIKDRIVFKILLLIFHCVQGSAPQYNISLVHPYIPARNLRSSTSRALIIPKSTKTWGERAFAHAGPYLWNSLPEDIKNCKSSESFKNHLKTYLFTHC